MKDDVESPEIEELLTMQDFIGFMFFSFIEGFGVLALMLYLFRINMVKFLLPLIFLNLFVDFVNYLIREEPSLSNIAPISNLLLCILFIMIVVKIPLVWSIVITLTGYMAFGAIQFTIIYFSFISIEELKEEAWKGYVFQTISGLVGTAIGFAIYSLGYGFTFEFEKLRFKWELILIISISIIFLVTLILSFVTQSSFSILIVFAVAFVFFLIYSYRKDAEHDR